MILFANSLSKPGTQNEPAWLLCIYSCFRQYLEECCIFCPFMVKLFINLKVWYQRLDRNDLVLTSLSLGAFWLVWCVTRIFQSIFCFNIKLIACILPFHLLWEWPCYQTRDCWPQSVGGCWSWKAVKHADVVLESVTLRHNGLDMESLFHCFFQLLRVELRLRELTHAPIKEQMESLYSTSRGHCNVRPHYCTLRSPRSGELSGAKDWLRTQAWFLFNFWIKGTKICPDHVLTWNGNIIGHLHPVLV